MNAHIPHERTFLLPEQRGVVVFSNAVLARICGYAQTRWWQREAGGQLFSATPHQARVVVSDATGPHVRDARSRHAFVPDPTTATRDRNERFGQGQHAVGLWHTHPEAVPSPSHQDRTTTREYLEAFEGAMDGFLLVTLGNEGTPLNMSVWLATASPRNTWTQLPEIKSTGR